VTVVLWVCSISHLWLLYCFDGTCCGINDQKWPKVFLRMCLIFEIYSFPLEMTYFAPSAVYLANSIKQHCLTSDWCHHLVNWMKHMLRLWFWPTGSIMWKHDIIHRTRSSLHNVLHCHQESQATDIRNIYRKFSEMWTHGFWDMQADRHANHNASHSYWGKVIRFSSTILYIVLVCT